MQRIHKPQGGTLRVKDTSYWQHECDRTPVEAGLSYKLKFPILSNVTFDKFFFTIASPNIRRHFGWLGLFAV